MEGRIGKVRYRLERDDQFTKEIGIAFITCGGSLGSTYGEPGRDMHREFKLTLGKWSWVLWFSWKDLSDER